MSSPSVFSTPPADTRYTGTSSNVCDEELKVPLQFRSDTCTADVHNTNIAEKRCMACHIKFGPPKMDPGTNFQKYMDPLELNFQ